MAEINISGLDKAAVLLTLYNHSHVQGLGFLQAIPNYTLREAKQDYGESPSKYFDYLHGRVIKCDLSGDYFDSRLYDRDNGEGAAQAAIDSIRF